jgi:RNA polymerase sigma factor, sigma-70 family
MLFSLFAWLIQDCLFFMGYIQSHSIFPKPLPPLEEQNCIQEMLAGDEAARHKLIEHNMRLVVHITKKYSIAGYTQDDLISVGAIGLIKAIGSYKPESGSLSGYAARCIENEVLMLLRQAKKRQADISLSSPISTDSEGNDITLSDIMGTPQDEVEQEVIKSVTLKQVRRVLHKLPKRERTVLELRYGLIDGKMHPQHEIADLLSISRSYVSRVEKHGLALLRSELKNCPL